MSEKIFKFTLLSVLAFAFIAAMSRPIEIWPDSEGYLIMDIYRSAGYPIVLWFLKNISSDYLDCLTIFFQITVGLIVIYLFVNRLKRLIVLHPYWYLLLALIMVSPYVYNHKLANNYLSEALTYSLYLLVTLYFLESLVLNNARKLWISFPILVILIMFRSQFLFMVPIAFLIIAWLFYRRKETKKLIPIALSFLILPFFTSLLDRTFHFVAHGHFVNTPWTGVPLITPAFYVADEQDYQLYDTEFEQFFFKTMYSQLALKNLNIHHLTEDEQYDKVSTYLNRFSEISNATIGDKGRELMDSNMSRGEKYIAVDNLTKKMVAPLIIDNFGAWLKLYLKNITHGFENSRYAALCVMMLIFGVWGMIKKLKPEYKAMALLSLLTLGNISLVALGMHTIKRFTFYNDWVLFFLIFILMNAFVKKIGLRA